MGVTEATCRETSTEMAKFGYWNIQGLGQPCRIALHYTGVEVEDTVWEIQKRNEWVAAKGANEWGLDFPNLPYYSDGEVKLTQSDAILRHLGRKNGLYGCSDADTAMVDMLIDTAKDIKMGLILPNVLMKSLNEPGKKEEVCKNQDAKFKQVSDFLGSKSFLMGNSVTIADFALYDALKWYHELDGGLVSKYKNIMDYIERFQALPKVQSFLNGPTYMKNFFPAFACFGGNR